MPRKAYLEFDANPDAEFEYALAHALKKTVGEIRQMPNSEYVRHYVYLGRRAQERELEQQKMER